jgi:hypothetical protein
MKNTKSKKKQDPNFKKFMLATVPQIHAGLCSRGDYTLTEHHMRFLEATAIESATRPLEYHQQRQQGGFDCEVNCERSTWTV